MNYVNCKGGTKKKKKVIKISFIERERKRMEILEQLLIIDVGVTVRSIV